MRMLDRKLGFLGYRAKLNYRSIDRSHYGHCLLQAALLARKLGHEALSAIEFGVAGGNGLVALEEHAEYVEHETGVRVATYGFDTGTGMPPPTDYRDLPYLWQTGYFATDIERLKNRLTRSKLLLGPVDATVPAFLEREKPPPLGFVAFDLDYYSSTVSALKIFDCAHACVLPRVSCYFDDIVGDIDWAYNEFTGELLAIAEFNAAHADIKIAPVHGLRFSGARIPQLWHEQIFVAHFFGHADYGRPVSDLAQLPLRPDSSRRKRRRTERIT